MPTVPPPFVRDLRELTFAVERAFAATGAGGSGRAATAQDATPAEYLAALGAVSSRYLAVGTPRSIGLVGDVLQASLSLAAHRTWFAPTDIRMTAASEGIEHARTVALAEALACDIVCICRAVPLTTRDLRRGTHAIVLVPDYELDRELAKIAAVSREVPDLGELAAGLVDGRQLDEITIFLVA